MNERFEIESSNIAFSNDGTILDIDDKRYVARQESLGCADCSFLYDNDDGEYCGLFRKIES